MSLNREKKTKPIKYEHFAYSCMVSSIPVKYK